MKQSFPFVKAPQFAYLLIFLLAVLFFVYFLQKRDPGTVDRAKQTRLAQMLSKAKFTPYDQIEFHRVIAEKTRSMSGPTLPSEAKQALQLHIEFFFSVYCNPSFEKYVEFKQSQGDGNFASGLLTNANIPPIEAWRAQWEVYLTGLRNEDTNLPANFRHRIKSVDLANLQVEIIKTTTTNSPTAKLSIATNFTGTIVLKNRTFDYATSPSDAFIQDNGIIWASWRIPCYTEHLPEPGFVRFTSYWDSLNKKWILYDGSSAIPPFFNPML